MKGRTLGSLAAAVALTIATVAAPAQKLQLAITVDDLPAHGELPPGVTRQQVAQSFLDTFHREHLPPIYGFVNGVRTVDAPPTLQVLQAWLKARQPLGNHTWAHTDLNDQTAEQFLADVDRNQTLLNQIDPKGQHQQWLRYPFLHEGDTIEKRRAVRAGLAARGFRIAEVSMDFEDYLWNDPYARCSAKNDPEALKYLHDSYLETADHYITVYRGLSQQAFHRDIPYVLLMHIGAFDAKMLPELLELYRKRGFTFVTMPHALNDKAYRLDPDHGDKDGGSFTELLLESRDETVAPDTKPYDKLAKLCR
ncbi:polysaccharide deacetylase family protein [Terriglobus aquaticus]|uniref:Polysaccharide deacetylase family protein n=1 Tax=Terriglobus aquaticus TaxID=940139 RepID=A0ABW9KGU3_9BACT|nr:polysaccharide deacetylase family protein [Terriglobus aquaticus]